MPKSPPSPNSPAGSLKIALTSLDPAEILAAVERLTERLELARQTAVYRMRAAGATWQEVADATGLNSRQAAQQTFATVAMIDRLAENAGRRRNP